MLRSNFQNLLITLIVVVVGASVSPQIWGNQATVKPGTNNADKFRQLGHLLRDPNVYRSAGGEPGPNYWQQNADYKIRAELDEDNRRVSASATITYTNSSPHTLRYIWVQLDQNRFRPDSLDNLSRTASVSEEGGDQLSFGQMRRHQALQDKQYGYDLTTVADGRGALLPYTVVDTMMRIDLPTPLRAGADFKFRIDWAFNIVEADVMNSRGGYEWFEETDTYQYFLAQWFPRVASFTDYTSWAHKPFLGRGEFTLEFGDYDVTLVVPADHIVSSTGVLMNPDDVLTAVQRERLKEAEDADTPVFVVTPDEALENEKSRATGTKAWRFVAKNVRDFAWASSRKYIWDAQGHRQEDKEQPLVMAMSFYPNEGEPIWSQYSTQSVIHTMEVYSRFSFAYPYPTAQSVNTWDRGGMEYPMITFNGYRPDPITAEDRESMVEGAPDETWARAIKYRLIGVIIHEIGHIYFPMIVNSDERQWTWMDEGINTFLEYLAELEWEENYMQYDTHMSILDQIASYMKGDGQVPIMTQSDSVLQFGPNAYTKPAAALVVLRETVLGRELFDYAFREYARRWKFKRPTPADFFRTMEDASGVDLDWFWRGWFYSTDHVDVDIAAIREYRVSSGDPDRELAAQRKLDEILYREPLEQIRNREEGLKTRIERVEGLEDFYNSHDKYTPSNKQRNEYATKLKDLEPWERRVLARAVKENQYVYFIDFKNVGGLVSPLPLRFEYASGDIEEMMIPAEIWRRNGEQITRLHIASEPLVSVDLDPRQQTGDVDRSNNSFPRKMVPSRLELYKRENTTRDLMRDMLSKLKSQEDTSKQVPKAP